MTLRCRGINSLLFFLLFCSFPGKIKVFTKLPLVMTEEKMSPCSTFRAKVSAHRTYKMFSSIFFSFHSYWWFINLRLIPHEFCWWFYVFISVLFMKISTLLFLYSVWRYYQRHCHRCWYEPYVHIYLYIFYFLQSVLHQASVHGGGGGYGGLG